MSAPPRLFDRALHRKRLDRAAAGFDAAGFLKARAADDMVARLEPIMRDFPVAVDLSARTGAFARAVATSDVAGRIGLLVEADLSLAMLAGRGGVRLVADDERLPFAAASLDLVVSTLGLHWTNDVVGALVQARLALKPDGLFVGAFLGGETLTELRQSLIAAEDEVTGGAGQRVSPFADPDGRLRATFEILTLTGWAPHESQQKPLKPGSARMRLADALGTVEHKLPREE